MADTQPQWIDDWLTGDRRALFRAITIIENEGREAAALIRAMRGRLGNALSVRVHRPAGRRQVDTCECIRGGTASAAAKVGVLAVDPSSPVSGGAILGDRIRMTRHADDDGVFVRSLASRGHLGGPFRSAVRVMDAWMLPVSM